MGNTSFFMRRAGGTLALALVLASGAAAQQVSLVGKTAGEVYKNIKVLMDALSEEGEADVKVQLQAGEGNRAPIARRVQPERVSGHVIGRTESLRGRNWEVTAVVSVQNQGFSKAQGTALMAAASRVEGQTHAFRKTTNRLRRARKINAAELLKGIA